MIHSAMTQEEAQACEIENKRQEQMSRIRKPILDSEAKMGFGSMTTSVSTKLAGNMSGILLLKVENHLFTNHILGAQIKSENIYSTTGVNSH